jgi:hypothetical protein
MMFRKPRTTVIVQDTSRENAQAVALAEERGRASASVAILGVTAIVIVLLLVGYFAWWAPVNQAAAQQQMAVPAPTKTVVHERVVERPVPTTTVVNPPPAPSTVIVKEQPAPPVQRVNGATPTMSDSGRIIIDNRDKNGNSPDVGNFDDTPGD